MHEAIHVKLHSLMTVHAAHGTPVYLTADVRAIESAAAAAPLPPQLMEKAGSAAAELARDVSGGTGKPVLVVAGPGNNGGGFGAAADSMARTSAVR